MVKEINSLLNDSGSSLSSNNIISEKDILVLKNNKDVLKNAVNDGSLASLISEMEIKLKSLDDSENRYSSRLKGNFENIQSAYTSIYLLVDFISKQPKEIAKDYEKELDRKEQSFRADMRRFFNLYKKCMESDGVTKFTDTTFLREFESLIKVYPQSGYSKKRVLIMTIQKSMHGIDPIIKDKINLEDLVCTGKDNNTLFIFDESDQAAIDMRNVIIQQQ